MNDKDILKDIDSSALEHELSRRGALEAAELLAEHSEHSAEDLMSGKLHSFAYKEALKKLEPVLEDHNVTIKERHEAEDLHTKLYYAKDTLTHWHAYN